MVVLSSLWFASIIFTGGFEVSFSPLLQGLQTVGEKDDLKSRDTPQESFKFIHCIAYSFPTVLQECNFVTSS